jgi:hypothetical protein
MTAFYVFAAQYVYILLLGLQSLNVNNGQYLMAAVTSTLLGLFGFYLTSVIGDARDMEFTTLWWGFVLSGPAGITSAMKLHPYLKRLFGGSK